MSAGVVRHPMSDPISIGTAGWNISRAMAPAFATDGRHLERYSRLLRCVEIDSSFHRPHRAASYARWSAATPDGFRFSVKLPKAITHDARLRDVEALLERFIGEVGGLGAKLGVLLVQLPPSLTFETDIVDAFFQALRARHVGPIACEPRHSTWFTPEADASLAGHRIARVAADPARTALASLPGGWLGADGDGRGALIYYRWHGSPRTYWSAYDDTWLAVQAALASGWPDGTDVWCVFDNTAAGAALDDALRFDAMTTQDRERLAMSRAIVAALPR